MITRYIQHLPKAILCCLLTIPCHAANDTIQLTVKAAGNQTKTITVSTSGTVLDIKQEVQAVFELPTIDQKLSFQKKELNDNKATLQSCGITQNNQELRLGVEVSYDPYVYIQYDGKTFAVSVEDDKTTIKEIKQEIATNKVGCPVDQQILAKSKGGQPLEDTKTVEDYDIPAIITDKPETLYLTLQQKGSTKVNSGQNNNNNIIITNKNNNNNLNNTNNDDEKSNNDTTNNGQNNDNNNITKLKTDTGLQQKGSTKVNSGKDTDTQSNTMNLTVERIPFGKPKTIQVPTSGTVLDIKQEIEEKFKIPTVKQKLSFNNTRLNENKKYLASYGITQGAELKVSETIIGLLSYLNIRYNKKTFAVLTPKDDQTTIQEIKQEIANNKVNCPVHQQILVWDNITLEDTKTISHYNNLGHESTLELTLDKNRSTKVNSGQNNNIIITNNDDEKNTNDITNNGQNNDNNNLNDTNNNDEKNTNDITSQNNNNDDNLNNNDNNNLNDTNNNDEKSNNDITNNGQNNNNNDITNNGRNNNNNNNENQDKDNTTTYIIAATCILIILGLGYFVKQNAVKKDPKSQDTPQGTTA